MDTHGSGGTSMDTHMVVGVMFGHLHGSGGTCMDTHDRGDTCMDTHGRGGTCMDTRMVVAVHVWTHT